MANVSFPTIDVVATGHRITLLRKQKGLTVKDLQEFFGLADVRAIYKWQSGQSLPSIDNLYALSILLATPMDQIIVGSVLRVSVEPQASTCGSHLVSRVIILAAR